MWFPRPPYPNDILAGALFSTPGGLVLEDNANSFDDEPRTFTWQVDFQTVYELLIGPFTYHSGTAGDQMEIRFRITDDGEYDVSRSDIFTCGSSPTYVSRLSRSFYVPSNTTLTASFGVRRFGGNGMVTFTYGRDDDPTLLGVRAIGYFGVDFSAEGVLFSQGVKIIPPESP